VLLCVRQYKTVSKLSFLGFEFFTAGKIYIVVILAMKLCSLVGRYRRFGGI